MEQNTIAQKNARKSIGKQFINLSVRNYRGINKKIKNKNEKNKKIFFIIF
jgi:hypothetical protein